ncbi:MAG: PorT family protein [Muribaculaceae bacterium]|nr:PorT family protein [Muribaculaceae bacterium]
MKALCMPAAILVCLALSQSASAQTHYKARMSAGVRGGVTLARQDLSPSVPQKFVMGSTGAVTFRYTEEKLFGLVAELGWTQRGWEEDFEESPLRYSRRFTYVTLPVMTQIIFGGRRAKCFINLGPEFSYMISENISSNFDYNDLSSVTDWPERKRMTEQLGMKVQNKFDYGITGGIGVEFYVQPRHSVTLEGRYYFGLGNIFKASKADTFSASRCTSIEISLGYNFRLR